MQNNKRLIVGIILLVVVALGLGIGGAYVWQGASPGYLITRQDIAAVPLLNPQTIIPPLSDRPEWGFAFSGIIETIDVENKFLDLSIPSLFPASLASFGYADMMRFYFDDDLRVRLVSLQTENGVATNVRIGKYLDISALKPGWPVRVFGQLDFKTGLYSAIQISVFEFLPGLPVQQSQ